MTAPFAWTGDAIAVTLDEDEASLLARLPQLLATVGVDGNDAAAVRLDPAVYPSDPTADDEYRRLMAPELDRARTDDRVIFTDTVLAGRHTIAVSDGEAWLRVIDEARLVLAARRGVVAGDDEWEHLIGSDPDLTFVAWLGYLQTVLIDALDAAGDAG